MRRRQASCRAAGALVLALLALAAGCSDVPLENAGVVPPTNLCFSDDDCAPLGPAVCDPVFRGCRAAAQPPDVVYVISFPTTTAPVPGYTVSASRTQLQNCRPLASACPSTGACFCLPPDRGLRDDSKSYEVQGRAAESVGFDTVYELLEGAMIVPVKAIFRPLAPLMATSTPAQLARVPLLTIEAQAAVLKGNPFPTPGSRDALGFRALLPAGRYVQTLEPEAPFDRFFPPVSREVDLDIDALGARIANVTIQPTFELESLENITGWELFLRDRLTGRRVSNLVSTGPGITKVRFFTIGYENFVSAPVDLVLSPPRGSNLPLPSMVSELIVLSNERMPRLPPPVRISGFVADKEGNPVAATMFFRSALVNEISQLDPVGSKLRFATDVATNDGGDFSVSLPPGRYDVAVIPAVLSGFGARVIPGGGEYRQDGAAGLGFTVAPRRRVTGAVRLPSGVALPGAIVRALPAIEPVSSAGPFGSLARAGETETAPDGTFALALDSGLYDLQVIPPAGTRWPTTRFFAVEVPDAAPDAPAPPIALPPFVVSAPFDLGFTFVNQQNSQPISGALVRAFAIPPTRTLPVELASGRTDGRGHVDLYAR